MTIQREDETIEVAKVVRALGLVPVQPHDHVLYDAIRSKDGDPRYGDAWTYLSQALNGYSMNLSPLGYVYVDLGSVAPVAFFRRPTDGRTSIHIINPLGPERLRLTRNLCEVARKQFDGPIYIKKLDEHAASQLMVDRRFRNINGDRWHAQAPLEDDTHPERVVSIKHTLELVSRPGRTQIRDKVRRFANRLETRKVVWRDLTPEVYAHAREVVCAFFGYKRQWHLDISEPHDYENMIVHPGPNVGSEALCRLLCYIDDRPCALVVLEQLARSEVAGLFCNLALYQKHRYLSEYVVIEAIKRAQACNFTHVNLGGSEGPGLDAFKLKFEPLESVTARWLVYE